MFTFFTLIFYPHFSRFVSFFLKKIIPLLQHLSNTIFLSFCHIQYPVRYLLTREFLSGNSNTLFAETIWETSQTLVYSDDVHVSKHYKDEHRHFISYSLGRFASKQMLKKLFVHVLLPGRCKIHNMGSQSYENVANFK